MDKSFVEVKKKYRGVVYKRRAALPLDAAVEGLSEARLPEETGQVGREAVWLVKRYGLMPAAVSSYDRDAWCAPDGSGIRVTLDRNLTFRNWSPDLNSRAGGLSLLPADRRLMEIKTNGTYPLWLVRLLQETGAQRTHFSKYGLAYVRHIRPYAEENERSETNCSTASLSRGA